MRVVLLEDERPARELLRALVLRWNPAAQILAELGSVAEGVQWLLANPAPDVLLADFQLGDGTSLEVLERASVRCPVVFVTAYDQHAMAALEAGGIDYVLKPVDPARLAGALDKVARLAAHFGQVAPVWRERILVRHGAEQRSVRTEDVAWFCTEHRLVFAVCRDGSRHIVDKTLATLSAELDPARFMRVSRSWIVHIDAVQGFRSGGKGRLRLRLTPEGPADAVVSAEHAAEFRAWLDR